VFNPNVEIIERSEMLESEENHVIDYGSTRTNNKNIIRAVYTRNHELLEECLAKENFFSTFFERWGVDTNFNAFELALKQRDKKAIQLLCNAAKNYSFKYAPQQKSSLSTFETESNHVSASRTHAEEVKMERGGKELEGPLTQDEGHRCSFNDDETITKVFKTVNDLEIFGILRASMDMGYRIENDMSAVLLAGNFILAAELVKTLRRQWYCGFTETHELALTADDPQVLENIRKSSCTAQARSSQITPIHLACINPNGKILEALLAECPEYYESDSLSRKPIHYAAACESPEPLAFLLKNNINYKVAEKNQETPLTIAAQCGRTKNIELLLTQGDKSIVSHTNKDIMNALLLAVENGHFDAVKLLAEYKANIEYHGR